MTKSVAMLLAAALSLSVHAAPKENDPEKRSKNVYIFEHALLPNLTHRSDGELFKQLQGGSLAKTRALAAEFVDAEFAGALKLTTIKAGVAYGITFEAPLEPPHCHHALVVKRGDAFEYFTLEMSFEQKTALCGWTKDGKHLNMGFRDYTDLKSFAKDAMKN